MDTSSEYILMCEKAKEIQHDTLSIGDFVWLGDKYLCLPEACRIITQSEQNSELNYDEFIWLPRQDQLQEMVNDKFSSREQIPALVRILDHKKQCTRTGRNPATWEQLWLSFVMYHKHNKQWNNNEWEVNK